MRSLVLGTRPGSLPSNDRGSAAALDDHQEDTAEAAGCSRLLDRALSLSRWNASALLPSSKPGNVWQFVRHVGIQVVNLEAVDCAVRAPKNETALTPICKYRDSVANRPYPVLVGSEVD